LPVAPPEEQIEAAFVVSILHLSHHLTVIVTTRIAIWRAPSQQIETEISQRLTGTVSKQLFSGRVPQYDAVILVDNPNSIARVGQKMEVELIQHAPKQPRR